MIFIIHETRGFMCTKFSKIRKKVQIIHEKSLLTKRQNPRDEVRILSTWNAKINVFFSKHFSNRSRRNEGILLKSVTTQTQIWNWTFLLVLTHCGAAELGRKKVSVTKPWPNYHIKKVHKALKSIEKGNSTSNQIYFKNYKFQFSFSFAY